MYQLDNNELVVDQTTEFVNQSIDNRFHFIGKCKLYPGVRIGYNTIIDSSIIDSDVIIRPNCKVFGGCVIGANSKISYNCVLSHRVRLGAQVQLHDGVYVASSVTIGDCVYITGCTHIGHNVTIGKATKLDIPIDIPAEVKIPDESSLDSLNKACIRRLREVGGTHLFTKWTQPDRTTTYCGCQTAFPKSGFVEVKDCDPSHVQCARGLHVCVPGSLPCGLDISRRIPLVVRVHVDDILHAGYFNIGPKLRVRKLEVLT